MSWQCLRLRAELVDFADGTLGEPYRRRVERHVASCARCSEAVLDLREARGRLERMAPADRPQEFWIRQREAILRAIAESPAPAGSATAVASSGAKRWSAPLALAASAALALLVSRWWSPAADSTPLAEPSLAQSAPSEPTVETVASVADESGLSQDTLVFDDTSLLGLAEQLQDDSTASADDNLI